MHSHVQIFVQDMAIIMLIAGLTTVICHRLKQPIVLGYIIAGIVIGPHTPPFSFITDETTIKTLAEIGVIFLMFSLGLEFNIHRLGKVGVVSVIAAMFEIILMIWLGYEIGRLFNWSRIDSIFLGAILSISSSTIIVKALGELKMKRESFAQLIFGILIVEDIFAVLILTILSSIALSGSLQFNEVILMAVKLSSFLIISLLLGILIVPRLLAYIASFDNNEVLLISVLGLCFGFCILVLKLEYSVALGAFIIGAIIAESQQLAKIEHMINPIRDMFSAVFFVSVGLLFNPLVVTKYFTPILVITIAVVIGKVVSCSLGVLATGRNGKTAMRVGMGLAQIGEFSFIIAALGVTLKVTSDFLYSLAVSVSIITTVLTPYLIKHSDALTKFLASYMPKRLASTFDVYETWMQQIQVHDNKHELRSAIKSRMAHVAINLVVVIAIFLTGSYLSKSNLGNALTTISNIYVQRSMIWTVCFVLSLPFLIAAYRKIKILSKTLAEHSIKERSDNSLSVSARRIISEIIPIMAILGMMALVSLLSTSILPPMELWLIAMVVVIIIAAVLMPWFNKLHAKLQVSLMKSMKNRD